MTNSQTWQSQAQFNNGRDGGIAESPFSSASTYVSDVFDFGSRVGSGSTLASTPDVSGPLPGQTQSRWSTYSIQDSPSTNNNDDENSDEHIQTIQHAIQLANRNSKIGDGVTCVFRMERSRVQYVTDPLFITCRLLLTPCSGQGR